MNDKVDLPFVVKITKSEVDLVYTHIPDFVLH